MIMTTLGELSVDGGSYGIAAPAVEYSSNLPTYLRITDICDDGTLDLSNCKSVDSSKAYKYILHENDIVFARTGNSTGRNYFYDRRDGEFVYAGFLIKFSLNPERVNPRYIKYYVQSQFYWDWIASYNTGSTRGNINAKTYESMPIVLPSRDVQDSIVKICDSISNKIRNSRQINDYLSETLKIAFADRFGSETPTVNLGSVMTISTRSLNPSNCIGEIWEHYSIPAYDENHRPVLEPVEKIKSNKYVIDNDCILISKLNPSTKRLWLPKCTSTRSVCSTEFIVYKPKRPEHKSFYYAAIDSPLFTDFLLAHVTGSTGSRQRAQPKATLDYPIPNPNIKEIEDFCKFANPMVVQQQLNEQESTNLEKLRDALLPKLISGELTFCQSSFLYH